MPTRENPLSGDLLRVLLVLLDEASVTRAAERLDLSQFATSLILKQLRDIFGDPLLVRAVWYWPSALKSCVDPHIRH
jgi:hypothetical protein